MPNLTRPAPPPKKAGEYKTRPRKPFPLSKGGEKVFVVSVKQEAPFEYVDIGGVHFTKYTISRECSNPDWSGPPVINTPTALLSQEQVDYLKERAGIYEISIPGKQPVLASDWIVLCGVEEYYKEQSDNAKKLEEKMRKEFEDSYSGLTEDVDEEVDSSEGNVDPNSVIKNQLKRANKK